MSTAHSTVLAEVGPRIVRGDLAEGALITLDWLGETYGVSRTVAREVVQVLVSMGLVESRRRTGIRIVFADQGPGIPDLDLALTDGYTTGGGLGLGLSGARRLVD